MSSKIPKLANIKQNIEIDILRPTDYKGITVKSKNETPVALETEAYEKTKYMIWKHGPGWSFKNKTKYLAIEGEPLTTYLSEHKEEVIVTVPEFIKLAWNSITLEGKTVDGDLAYNKLSAVLRSGLEDLNWAATVTVKPAEFENERAELKLSELRAQEMLKESSIEMANDVAKSTVKEGGWAPVMRQLYLIGFGAFLMYFVDHALELF